MCNRCVITCNIQSHEDMLPVAELQSVTDPARYREMLTVELELEIVLAAHEQLSWRSTF